MSTTKTANISVNRIQKNKTVEPNRNEKPKYFFFFWFEISDSITEITWPIVRQQKQQKQQQQQQ